MSTTAKTEVLWKINTEEISRFPMLGTRRVHVSSSRAASRSERCRSSVSWVASGLSAAGSSRLGITTLWTMNPRRGMRPNLPSRASAKPPYRLPETRAACGESWSVACRRLQQRRS
jgi:hypothetical protein